MSNVNAYYAGPTAVPAVPAQPASNGQPQPVVVNVNNASAYQQQPSAQTTFGADQYAAYAQQATAIAAKAAPYMPGAAAGRTAAKGVSEAKQLFEKASRSRSMATKAKAGAQGRSLAFGGILSAVKSSVLFNGAISLALNGYKVFKKEQTVSDAGGNVTGDIASAAVGGAAGAAASAAGTALLAGVIGTGFPLTLVGLGLGIGGYMLADKVFRNTTLFKSLTQGAHDLIAKVTGK
jgi:hypothetical protein